MDFAQTAATSHTTSAIGGRGWTASARPRRWTQVVSHLVGEYRAPFDYVADAGAHVAHLHLVHGGNHRGVLLLQ